MITNTLPQKKVKHKVYEILPTEVSVSMHHEPFPKYSVDPLEFPGQKNFVGWEKFSPQPSQGFLVEFEGGVSSKKLIRAGQVWYLKEYYKPDGTDFHIKYGPRDDVAKVSVLRTACRLWAEEDYEKEVLEAEIEKLSGSVSHTSSKLTDEEREERKRRNQLATKQRFRELVNMNELCVMFTFSFAPELNEAVPGLRFTLPIEDQKDRKKVLAVWNKRLSVIRKKLAERGHIFRYVMVPEKHTGEKSKNPNSPKIGTYHFHLATDRYIDIWELQEWWGYGIVNCRDFSKPHPYSSTPEVIDPGIYMSKYMDKGFDEAELHNARTYTCSQNLKRPIPERDEEAVAKCIRESDAEYYTVFDAFYQAEYELMCNDDVLREVTFFVRSRIFNFKAEKKSAIPLFNVKNAIDKYERGY